jgi:hypothetical protein
MEYAGHCPPNAVLRPANWHRQTRAYFRSELRTASCAAKASPIETNNVRHRLPAHEVRRLIDGFAQHPACRALGEIGKHPSSRFPAPMSCFASAGR